MKVTYLIALPSCQEKDNLGSNSTRIFLGGKISRQIQATPTNHQNFKFSQDKNKISQYCTKLFLQYKLHLDLP